MGFAWILIIFIITSFNLLLNTHSSSIICPIDSLYQFGDSKSDTGNLIRISPNPPLPAARLPYGETFPGYPTGRWSDGLLTTDFIARALGLPLINPYWDRNASFLAGVNFAVAGSTALDISFLASRGVIIPNNSAPLSLQLSWFRTHLNSICSTPKECQAKLRRALVIVGVIGSNDIIFGLTQGRSLSEVRDYLPFVSQTIVRNAREVIRLGAKTIVVPGAFALGCLPLFVNGTLPTNRTLDEFGCLSAVNNLSAYLNKNTKKRLDSLRKDFPNVNIIYSDNYNAFLTVLRRASLLGFDPNTLLGNCCGAGGAIFENPALFCGSPGTPLCPNPARYISWDGIHFTHAAYRRFSEILIPKILSKIRCFIRSPVAVEVQ